MSSVYVSVAPSLSHIIGQGLSQIDTNYTHRSMSLRQIHHHNFQIIYSDLQTPIHPSQTPLYSQKSINLHLIQHKNCLPE